MAQLKAASSWEDMHMIFAKHGLDIKPRGAGLAVKNRHGKQANKASVLHREQLGLGRLLEKGTRNCKKESYPMILNSSLNLKNDSTQS